MQKIYSMIKKGDLAPPAEDKCPNTPTMTRSGKIMFPMATIIERRFSRSTEYHLEFKKHSIRCGCGRLQARHFYLKGTCPGDNDEKWNVLKHTELIPTDAYGTIEFQGGPHPTKAQYVRVSYDSKPELILQLLQKQWGLELPKLLISVHGGIANFDLQPKLKRVFRKGLLKAAKTTGAWIVTGGTNTGVMRHVGDALGDTLAQARNNVVTIGIAPWGVVHNRNDLIGKDTVTPYHAIAAPKSHNVVLNSNHSYFILVDNGTIGKYGAEILLRKKLEKYISQQKITTRSGTKNYSTPVVCLILEGGTNTIRTVLECITDTPPVPVVVCDGSGRAADLLAFTHKYAQDDGTMPETLRDQLILTVEKTFQYSREQAEKLFIELMLCVKKKELMTVFRMSEGSQDIDLAILTALLKGQNATAPDQLSLALTWNRVDIARSHIFVYGQEWPEGALDQAMMDALVNDRVEFVKLLLENGVSMQKWLTIQRLEELYNIKQDPSGTLRYLIRENKKNVPPGYRYTLFDIGMVMEQLMGGAYRASYCRRKFRTMYNAVLKKGHHISNIVPEVPMPVENSTFQEVFKYPFNELMVWAVLLKRQKMAMFMWQHGEEALAKALIAMKLLKSMAREAAQDELEMDVSEELKGDATQFANLALELLEHSYKTDDDLTQQLLTYELNNWSDQTCLSLAVSASHRDLIAHTCCQILLTEMWMGGLRMRKYTSLKVILGILFFPAIFFLEFKSKEELQLMPQTMEEHIQELEDSDSDDSSLSSSESGDESASEDELIPGIDRRSSSKRHSSKSYDQMLKRHLNATASSHMKGQLPTANGTLLTPDISMTFRKKNSPLRLGKKIYEFYTAPVTKFWAQTIGFIVFMCIFTYVVLIRIDYVPKWNEIYVIAYVFTFGIEKCREVIVSEPAKFSQKLYVFFSETWNICDTIAVILFLIGVTLRLHPATHLDGRVFYCVDIILWYIRILDIFSVNKYLGPYVMMIGKMVKDMVKFIVILLIVLMSFGIARHAIRFPNAEPSWEIAKDIYLEPYFMIYGEVYAGSIDPECGPEEEFECVPGRWLVPAIMAVYLIVANILLINLLIAVFNNTFHRVNAISTKVWKFLRYSLVIEFESKPILPPPFIFICHIYLIIKYFVRRCKGKREYFDNGLKLFLCEEDVEKLHDFEEECVEDYFREKETQIMCSTDERIRQTAERVENMSMRMDDFNQKENAMKLSLTTIDFRLAKLEEVAVQTAENMYMLQNLLALQGGIIRQSSEQGPPLSGSSAGSTGSQGGSLDFGMQGAPQSAPATTGTPGLDPRLGMFGHFSGDKKYASPSKRKRNMNEERLRPFTDYTRNSRRPPFTRAITVATPGRLCHELTVVTSNSAINQEASNFNEMGQLGQKERSPPAATHPPPGSDLYYRRRTKALSRLRSQGLFKALKEEQRLEGRSRRSHGRKSPARVTFSDPPSKEASPDARRSMSADAVENLPNFSANVGKTGPYTFPTHNLTHYTMAKHNLDTTSTTRLVLSPSSPPLNIPQAQQASGNRLVEPPTSLGVMPSPICTRSSAVSPTTAPITPIVTPNHSEYTSITDEIDTTGVNFGSPCGSPTTPRQFYFGVDVNVDLYTKKAKKNKKNPISTELSQSLKFAEDSEHDAMELMIRKRMRQISLTESESLSDIARHVDQVMEENEQPPIDDKPGYHSDEDIPTHLKELEEELPALTRTNSEPMLNKLGSSAGSSFERESVGSPPSTGLSRSLSPPRTVAKGEIFPWPEKHHKTPLKGQSVEEEEENVENFPALEAEAEVRPDTVC